MRHLRPTIISALCLIVFAASVTQAMARGQMAAGQMVQLCVGGEAVTVVMDAQGNPVDPAHPCPECVAGTAALPPLTGTTVRPIGPAQYASLAALVRTPASAALCACARGPPAMF